MAGFVDSFAVGYGDIYLIKTDFNGNLTRLVDSKAYILILLLEEVSEITKLQ